MQTCGDWKSVNHEIMKNIGTISLVLAAWLFAGCATQTATKTLTVFDNDKQINLVVGQPFMVQLASNPTTGYRWIYQQQGTAILEPVGEPRYLSGPAAIGMVGGGGTEYFMFKAKSIGQQTLKLEYLRPFERDVPPVQTVSYNLVVSGTGQ
jgi:inhibitor of cysteine peptidase